MQFSFHRKSNEEQYEIITAAKNNKAILGRVIEDNDHLIWHTIKTYVGDIKSTTTKYVLEKDDLYQVGCIGFIKSIKDFDCSKGVKFSTYAVPKIYREIKCYLRDNGNILRLTRTASELSCQIENLSKTHGDLTPEEIASSLKVDVEKINKALTVGKIMYAEEIEQDSIQSLVSDDSDIEKEIIDNISYDTLINKIFDRLDEVEKKVFEKKYIQEEHHKVIASDLNINKMKVARIVEKIKDVVKNLESD